ncbi:MAG: hypothetical protein MO853_07550 [Candidatus Protistobacter heckmanni]|nr:hypothetical protein [Candidatus Protistobacter heckmanni]
MDFSKLQLTPMAWPGSASLSYQIVSDPATLPADDRSFYLREIKCVLKVPERICASAEQRLRFGVPDAHCAPMSDERALESAKYFTPAMRRTAESAMEYLDRLGPFSLRRAAAGERADIYLLHLRRWNGAHDMIRGVTVFGKPGRIAALARSWRAGNMAREAFMQAADAHAPPHLNSQEHTVVSYMLTTADDGTPLWRQNQSVAGLSSMHGVALEEIARGGPGVGRAWGDPSGAASGRHHLPAVAQRRTGGRRDGKHVRAARAHPRESGGAHDDDDLRPRRHGRAGSAACAAADLGGSAAGWRRALRRPAAGLHRRPRQKRDGRRARRAGCIARGTTCCCRRFLDRGRSSRSST